MALTYLKSYHVEEDTDLLRVAPRVELEAMKS